MRNVVALPREKTKTSISVNRKVTPIWPPNRDLRPREGSSRRRSTGPRLPHAFANDKPIGFICKDQYSIIRAMSDHPVFTGRNRPRSGQRSSSADRLAFAFLPAQLSTLRT